MLFSYSISRRTFIKRHARNLIAKTLKLFYHYRSPQKGPIPGWGLLREIAISSSIVREMEGPIPADPDPDPDPDPESLMAEIIPDKAVSDIRPKLWMSPGFSETLLTSPTFFGALKIIQIDLF